MEREKLSQEESKPDNERPSANEQLAKAREILRIKRQKGERSLTPTQKLFVEEFLLDLNPAKAAIRVGIPKDQAYRRGKRWLKIRMIRDAIRRALAIRSARTQITADKVLRELALIAFSDTSQIGVDPYTGAIITPEGFSDLRKCISSKKYKVKLNEGESLVADVELKFHDKINALKMLAQHLDILNQKEVTNNAPGVLVLQGVDPKLILGQQAASSPAISQSDSESQPT